MFRDDNSFYLDELVEFCRDFEAAYYVGRKVNANAELVCDGLAIDCGGNTPQDECNQIVSAARHAYEAVLGFGSTKSISFFHAARQVGSADAATCFARAALDGDGAEDERKGDVDGERKWIERKDLPPAVADLVEQAEAAFDNAWDQAVADVEAQHTRMADGWIKQLIADGNWVDLRDAIDNPSSCASAELVAEATSLLTEHSVPNHEGQ